MKNTITNLILFCLIFLSTMSFAQDQDSIQVDTFKIDLDKVSTIDGTIKLLYSVISGPAGPRDWDTFRALYKPYATLVAGRRNKDGSISYGNLSVEDYINSSGAMFKKMSFEERETGRVVEEFQNIAQVFSSYSAVINGDLEKPLEGINSIQLLKEDGRWWIVSLMWDHLTKGSEIPEKYLYKE